jgi:DNA/RNA endonuclease YhcR with UshA esterase domain
VSLRGLRSVSLLTALVGTALVWAVARSTGVPTIRVADAGDDMDWAYVEVAGIVTRHPSYDPSSGQLSFWLDDGTGEIRAVAYRPVSDHLVEAPQVPVLGDRVQVEGTLRLRPDLDQVVISLPSALRIERPDPVVSSIAQLTRGHIYRRVCLRGQVRSVRVPYEGLVALSLRDATGEMDVVVERAFAAVHSAVLSLELGEQIEVCGAVTSYDGQLQLALDGTTAIGRLPTPVEIAPQRQIAGIGRDDLGQLVRLQGTIAAVTSLQSGLKLLVDDGSGRLVVILWQDVIGEREGSGALTEGTPLGIYGRVTEYRGQLEVVPEIPDDVRWLGPAIETAQPLSLGEVDRAHLGETVIVQAQIVYSVPAPSGVRFRLRDEDGEGYLLAWSDWLELYPGAAQLVPGAWVSARGTANLYEGTIELVPQHAADVIVTGMEVLAEPTRLIEEPTLVIASTQAAPTIVRTVVPARTVVPVRTVAPAGTATVASPAQAIVQTGAVLPEMAGRQVTVEGTLVDLVLFDSGQRCLVDDGSGPLALWLPGELFAAAYSDASWQFGSIVRATGLVQVYQEEAELVPEGPGNLLVVQAAPPQVMPPTRMGDLREQHVGQRIAVEGQVVEVWPFSQGIKYLLDDGSGRLTLLLWQSVLDDLPGRDCLALGTTVRAAGRVSAYQGALELAPGVGRDVVCLR